MSPQKQQGQHELGGVALPSWPCSCKFFVEDSAEYLDIEFLDSVSSRSLPITYFSRPVEESRFRAAVDKWYSRL